MLPADPPISVSGASVQAWLTCPVFLPSDLLPPNYSKAQLDEWYSSLSSINSSLGEWGLQDFPRVSPERCSSSSFVATTAVSQSVIYLRVPYKLRSGWQGSPGGDGMGVKGSIRSEGSYGTTKPLPGRARRARIIWVSSVVLVQAFSWGEDAAVRKGGTPLSIAPLPSGRAADMFCFCPWRLLPHGLHDAAPRTV